MQHGSSDPKRVNPNKMNLKELFSFPERSHLAPFAEAQIQLYRHSASLQDYFYPLQKYWGRPRAGAVPLEPFSERALSASTSRAYQIARLTPRRKYRVDVLLCPIPYTERLTEIKLFVRTLMGLAQTGATLLCLLPEDAPCRSEVVAQLEAERRSGQVILLDPLAALNPVANALLRRVGRDRGRSTFAKISQLLQPLGLDPPQESRPDFERIARFVEAWSAIEHLVEFDAVVARCHWGELGSPVCRTAYQRGKPVITFQQGVIDHTLDVPVTASHYVAFGRSSAVFLARMNHLFFQAVEKPEPGVQFVPSGSLFDTLLDLPSQFANRTLLALDNADPNGFYGLNVDRCGVLHLIRQMLQSGLPLRRVIIRLHPYSDCSDLEAWKELVREHPDSCELSSAAWTLEDDLKRSSVVVGNFSGALTVASASGLPTFFVEPDGFATGDLACFRHGQTLPAGEALREIRRVLADAREYAEARAVALRNARDYYEEGANARLDASFFERMLHFNLDLASASADNKG